MILTDLSDTALGRAARQNLIEFFRFTRRAPSVEYVEGDGLARWMTRVPHPWFNGIYLGRPPRRGDDFFLDDAATHFDHHRVSLFTCWIDAEVDRAQWEPTLIAHGFRYDAGAPGMALVLDASHDELTLPAGFSMSRVTALADLETWCRTFLIGYELPMEWYGDFHRLMVGLGLYTPMANYLGHFDGEAVVTSSVFYGAGVAGVQFVATAPHARRKGFGALATLYPLAEARASGYRAAILQSSEMGVSVYARIGFRRVGDVDNYYRGAQA